MTDTVVPAARGRRPANLFDLLRLVAAAMVIVGHSWSLLGLPGVPTLAGITIHHLGVYVFFTISGFLLSTSWTRSPRPGAFLLRRCLRIFPALWLVVLLTIAVLGPVLTTLPLSDYAASPETWRYLWNLILVAQYDLPGLFASNDQSAVNGSLWSLGPEFCCYLMVVVIGALGPRVSLIARAVLAGVLLMIVVAAPLDRPLRITLVAVVFFLAGSLLSALPRISQLPWWTLILGLAVLVPFAGRAGIVAACLVVPVVVVSLGSRTSSIARGIQRWGDPSYGMYLWAFPIQQTLIATAPPLPLALNIVVVLALSAGAGYASWHALEKRAIALGARLSSRVSRPELPAA